MWEKGYYEQLRSANNLQVLIRLENESYNSNVYRSPLVPAALPQITGQMNTTGTKKYPSTVILDNDERL